MRSSLKLARRLVRTMLFAVGLSLFATIQHAAGQETAASTPDQSQFRTWTNRQGSTIEAKFIALDGDKVVLKKKDDVKLYPVPIENLSDDDRQYVQQHTAAKAEPAPAPVVQPAVPPKPAKPGPRWATFVNRKTGRSYRGKIIEQENLAREGWRYRVENPDGQIAYVWASQWIIHRETPSAEEAGGDEVSRPEPMPAANGPLNVVEPNLGPRTPRTAALPQAREVEVTGVGTDPDKAIQNAFSQAIEQTVGVLVDAESKVKNDQLIRDEVLTYSQGYIEKYEVVKRWEEGGLHHATIQATVARGELVAKLTRMKIAMRAVDGIGTSIRIAIIKKNEEQAAKMFEKALAKFDMTKLTKVEVVGEPEITREGVNAKIHVGVRVSPDMEQWRKYSKDLRAVLGVAATRRGALTRGPSGVELSRESPVVGQLDGNGMLIGLFSGNATFAAETGIGGKSRLKSVAAGGKWHGGPASSRGKSSSSNTSAGSTQWEMFRVPAVLEEALREGARGSRYCLVCILLDANGNDLVRTTVLRSSGSASDGLGEVIYKSHEFRLGDVWWLGPVWWRESHGKCMPAFEVETTLEISQDDLGKVANTAGLLERDTRESGESSSGRPTKKRSVSSDDSGYSKKKSHSSGE